MKTKILILLITLSMGFPSAAQDLVIENVSTKMRKFRGVGHMEGKGHTLFIVDEKSSKGMKLFKFYLWDFNLNEIANRKIELEKRRFLIDEAAHDKNNLLVFYDKKRNNVRAMTLDNQGEIVADITENGIKTKFLAI